MVHRKFLSQQKTCVFLQVSKVDVIWLPNKMESGYKMTPVISFHRSIRGMCLGYMQILCHLTEDLEHPGVMVVVSWNQSIADTEGQLY